MTDQQDVLQPQRCPACSSARMADQRCGCRDYECGSTLTCDDYHHGDGVLLDCPSEVKA